MASCFSRSKSSAPIRSCCHIVQKLNQFSIELFYFICVSLLGFLILRSLKSRTDNQFKPRNIDLFFTSVSATTVSSMSVIEMEVFSNTQLIVITVLMFIGGEVFTSMAGLHIRSLKHRKIHRRVCPAAGSPTSSLDQVELELGAITTTPTSSTAIPAENQNHNDHLKTNSIKYLAFVVLGYLLIVHLLGISSVLLYINLVPSAENELRKKGLKQFTFVVFTIVSTFASCGFVPTNENMIVFKKNSVLLLLLIPQILLGNTLFPPALRLLIWFLGKIYKKKEFQYLLQNSERVSYFHLLPGRHSWFLAISAVGFIAVQFIVFCSLEWNSETLIGMSTGEKIAGVLFQTTNARHTGEGIVDLSAIAPAMLVLFIIMMYLPPYTSYLPRRRDQKENPEEHSYNFIFSQLAYLSMFIILICITERKRLKEDPLNFNVLSITFEVISAYGNVGFTIGYSCGRQLKADPTCVDKWYGFAGKWSDEGKLILVAVMFFGRLKKFSLNGGKAWKLL